MRHPSTSNRSSKPPATSAVRLLLLTALVATPLSLVGAWTPATAETVRYTVTDFGPLVSTAEQRGVYRLNDAGDGAGVIYPVGSTDRHPFLYQDGVGHDLGTLGGTSGGTCAINAAGVVAGSAGLANGERHAFTYADGSMTDLGTLGGSFSDLSCMGSGREMNARGDVVGASGTVGDTERHAFRYSNGHMADLGTLGGDDSRGDLVNASGEVAGASNVAVEGNYHAFLDSGGGMADLGTLGGSSSFPEDLNDAGAVVGSADVTGNEVSHGFLYTGGQMQDLQSPDAPDGFSNAMVVNASGQVLLSSDTATTSSVPFIWTAGDYTPLSAQSGLPVDLNDNGDAIGTDFDGHGWVWTGGQLYPLKDVLAPGSGIEEVGYVYDLNNAGQITAYAQKDGVTHSVLLTPTTATGTVAGRPTSPTAAAGDGRASVSWVPPASDGDSQITSYTVTAHAGAASGPTVTTANGSTTTATVLGLQNGQAYTFTVSATNGVGDSDSSDPSNVVTPAAGQVQASGTVSDGGGGTVATSDPGAPMNTSVQVPAGTGGGVVALSEQPSSGTPPTGFTFLGTQVQIVSTAHTTLANPLTVTFTAFALPAPTTFADVGVTRAEGDGAPAPVPDCPSPAVLTAAQPLCIVSRSAANPDGSGAILSVLTAQASLWNLAVTPVRVSVTDSGYAPKAATSKLGRRLLWTFTGRRAHSVTDALRLGASSKPRFDSGPKTTGTFVTAFAQSGTYAYRSSVKGDNRTGSVAVPVVVSPPTGGRRTTFTVRWATSPLPSGYAEDVVVRRKAPHSSRWTGWAPWRSDAITASANFVPPASGTYQFQARLRNKSTGAASGYSPAVQVVVP